MNQFEPDKNEALVDSEPLFASTWLTLFSVLRRNYNERRIVDPADVKCLKTPAGHEPGQNLN